MLLVARSVRELDFPALMAIYAQTNVNTGALHYPNEPTAFQLQLAEEDFRQYLFQCFFRTQGAFYAVWVECGAYVSAARVEPYRDGVILTGLETMPQARGKGYGQALVKHIAEYQKGKRIYSHVDRTNLPSLRLHEKCGFRKILDYAVYLDGSVLPGSLTLCLEA